MSDSIPRIIHQRWNTDAIPDIYKPAVEAWKRLHPSYQYILWTDETSRAYIRDHYPQYLDMYDSFEYHIQRCDFIRPIILKDFGGIYADLDLYPAKSLEPYLQEFDKSSVKVYLVDSPVASNAINSFMISKPGASFWDLVLSLMTPDAPWWALTKHFKVMTTTGPLVLQKAVNKTREPITFLPKSLFNAYGMGDDCSVEKPDVIMRCTKSESTWASIDTWFFVLFLRYPQQCIVVIILILMSIFYYLWVRCKTCKTSSCSIKSKRR